MELFTNFSLSCGNCGAPLGEGHGNKYHCVYCGYDTYITNPIMQDSSLVVANSARESAQFDMASSIYREILDRHNGEDVSDVYWYLFLCEQNVIFETDEKGDRFPSFYRIISDSAEDSPYYEKAVSCAKNFGADWKISFYESMKEKIVKAKDLYRRIKESERPYDIFVCFKKSDNNGSTTPDTQIGMDIYNEFSRDYRVFFSERSLRATAVRDYEPNIYYALYSARVMLLICSKKEYIESQWVKNEWARYNSFAIYPATKKTIIPIFTDEFTPDDLPSALMGYQGMKDDRHLFDSLKKTLKKIFAPPVEDVPVPIQSIPPTTQPPSIQAINENKPADTETSSATQNVQSHTENEVHIGTQSNTSSRSSIKGKLILPIIGILALIIFAFIFGWQWSAWQWFIGIAGGALLVGIVIWFNYDYVVDYYVLGSILLGVCVIANFVLFLVFKENYSTVFYCTSAYELIGGVTLAILSFNDCEEEWGKFQIVSTITSVMLFVIGLACVFSWPWLFWQWFIGIAGGAILVGIVIWFDYDYVVDYYVLGSILLGVCVIANFVLFLVFKENYSTIFYCTSAYELIGGVTLSTLSFDDDEDWGTFQVVSTIISVILFVIGLACVFNWPWLFWQWFIGIAGGAILTSVIMSIVAWFEEEVIVDYYLLGSIILGVCVIANFVLFLVFKENYSTIFYCISAYELIGGVTLAILSFNDCEEEWGTFQIVEILLTVTFVVVAVVASVWGSAIQSWFC